MIETMRPRQIISNDMLVKRNEFLVLVSNLTGVPVDDIMTNNRCGRISMARQLVMWALYELCSYTTTQVGILMRRNHATITYAVSHVGGGYYGKEVESIREKIKDYHNESKTQNRH